MSSVELYIDEIQKYPSLTLEEEAQLLQQHIAGDTAAKDKLLCAHLRFVFQIARSYQNQGLDLEDLIAEGNTGLIKALDKFKPEMEVKFISYAVWWIRQAILAAIYKYSGIVRLPINQIANSYKTGKLREALELELEVDPYKGDTAGLLNELNLEESFAFPIPYVSLDEPIITQEGEGTLHDVLPAEEVKYGTFAAEFFDTIENFSYREKKILTMYFGIGEIREHTLKEIGADLGLTRERVRQLKIGALEKLKLSQKGKNLGENHGFSE